ncbi:MAG: iron-sulfur cluster assembly accessory protein [Proteobacteria bacterium]|nr:iron-sulfur cluster assembly accessory protein [Pseudomonadota bacterium]
MITISESAQAQIKAASEEDEMKGMALRLAIRRDDAGAFEYGIGFDDINEDDIKINQDGFMVVMSPAYKDILNGLSIDYVEIEPDNFHFIFVNPNDPDHVAPGEDRDNLNS